MPPSDCLGRSSIDFTRKRARVYSATGLRPYSICTSALRVSSCWRRCPRAFCNHTHMNHDETDAFRGSRWYRNGCARYDSEVCCPRLTSSAGSLMRWIALSQMSCSPICEDSASHLEVVEWLAAKANTRPVSESKQANAGLGRNEVAWKRLLMHRVDLPFLFHADGH
eukprot:1855379-Rhodomonas_salina.1